MEQFVLGIFQEHLSKFVIGFRKEQVNANLLNGKGSIQDILLNCSFLNEQVRKVTPYVEFERVHLSHLSFKVSSWTNIRQSPILISLGHVTAVVNEPWRDNAAPATDATPRVRRPIRHVTARELQRLVDDKAYPKPRTSSYNLLDRILDNVTVEMQSLSVTLAPLGKFQAAPQTAARHTVPSGPWTPPAIRLQLFGIRLVSVNEHGHEGTPDEVWRHNHTRRTTRSDSVWIYKKVSCEYQVSLVGCVDNVEICLVSSTRGGPSHRAAHADSHVEVQLAYQRRVRTSECVKVQVDVVIPTIELTLEASTIPLVVQVLAALHHCWSKQHALGATHEPPLVDSAPAPLETHARPTHPSVDTDTSLADTAPSADDTTAEKERTTTDHVAAAPVAESMPNDIEAIVTAESGDTSSTLSEQPSVEESTLVDTPSLLDLAMEDGMSEASDDGVLYQSQDASSNDDLNEPPLEHNGVEDESESSSPVVHARPVTPHERPKLAFPNGLILHEKLSIRVSVHKATVYGIYRPADDGRLEIAVQGVVAEALWPTVTHEKGGYLQASVSHICVQEWHAQRLRPVLIGGASAESNLPLDVASSSPLPDSDESFPFFETRNVRPDPIGLAQPLSSQALGVKLTVNVKKQTHAESAEALDDVMLLCEMGMDQFEFVLDSTCLCRMAQFALNLSDGGFDPRWFSGDYGECVMSDIQSALDPLDIGSFVSTEMASFKFSVSFNATVRATNMTVKIPAPISKSLRSCDIVVQSSEAVLTISSALPRTMFTASDPSQPEFPNDPSDDVCNFDSNDNASLSEGDSFSVTFRCQQKVKGLTCQLVPVLPALARSLPQHLLLSTDVTILIGLEAESSEQSTRVGSLRIMSLLSIVVYRLNVNVDFDRLGAMLTTLIGHHKTIQELVPIYDDPAGPDEAHPLPQERDASKWTALPHRQLLTDALNSLGMETKMIHAACSLRVLDCRIRHWHYIAAPTPQLASGLVVPLYESSLSDLEVHLQDTIASSDNHCLAKVCLAEFDFKIGDFSGMSVGDEMIPVFDCAPRKKEHSLAVRLEEVHRKARTWALSAEILDGSLYCHLEELAAFVSIVSNAFSTSFASDMLKSDNATLAAGLDETMSAFKSGAAANDSSSVEARTTIKGIVEGMTAVVNAVLIRLSSNDFRICIPNAGNRAAGFDGIELRVWDLELLASVFTCDDMTAFDVIDVIARQQERWPEIVSNCKKGLRHRLKSSQSLHIVSPDIEAAKKSLVDTFDLSVSCGEMLLPADTQERVDQQTEDVAEALFRIFRRCQEMCSNIETMRTNTYGLDNPVNDTIAGTSPTDGSSGPSSFQLVKGWMRTMRETFGKHSYLLATMVASKDAEIAALRTSLFIKENERVAALALVSSEASGWLRLASSSQSNKRALASCVFWPHWAVLRGSLLILYVGPGQCRVIGIISLRGASIRELEGGQRNVDLKRAFAVAEYSGMLHFAITGSDAEYITWVVAIKRAIDSFSTIVETPLIPHTDETNVASGIVASGDSAANSVSGSGAVPSANQPLLQAEVGADEPGNRILSLNVDETLHEDTSSGNGLASNSDHGKQLLRNRFASVRQATKSRLGSAISAAKQKSIEVAAKGKEIVHKGREAASVGNSEGVSAGGLSTASQPSVPWACASCTYLNAAVDRKCEMCGAVRQLELPGGIQDQATSNASGKDDSTRLTDDLSADLSSNGEEAIMPQEFGAPSMVADQNQAGRSIGMKQRLGAVVRRAMATTDNPRLLAMRKQEPNDSLPNGAPSSVKLHKIAISGPLQAPRHPFSSPGGLESLGVLLKRLQGNRSIRVHIHVANGSTRPVDGDTAGLSLVQSEPPSMDASTKSIDSVARQEIHGTDYPTLANEVASTLVDTTFRIEIVEHAVDALVAASPTILLKRLPDILSLHTALSESIVQIPSFLFDPDLTTESSFNDESDETTNHMRDFASLDLVRTSGLRLGGLLEDSQQTTTNYHSECIAAFLNSMVNSPLPIEFLASLTGFLQLADACTRNAATEVGFRPSGSSQLSVEHTQALDGHASEIDRLSVMCELELVRAERRSIAIGGPVNKSTAAVSARTTRESPMSLRDPLHSALLRVMEERDQIHVRMTSEHVLHAYEANAHAEERTRLLAQLDAIKLEHAKNSPKPRLDRKALAAAATVAPKSHDLQQDSDAELLSLCQQLAGEISARTAASLEVIRLQESHSVEREHDAAAMQALNHHVTQLEDELAVQRHETQALKQERDRWRVAYEDAMMKLERTEEDSVSGQR